MFNKFNISTCLFVGFGFVVALNLLGKGIVWRHMVATSAQLEQITGQFLKYE